MERNDVVDERVEHSCTNLGRIDANDDVANIGIITLVHEVLIIDVDTFCGVIVQHYLAILHVVAVVTGRNEASVQLDTSISYQLCKGRNLGVSLNLNTLGSAVDDNLHQV